MERVQAVTRVIQTKEKIVLNPRNRNVRELIKRSSVRTLNDGTEVLLFRSEQGVNKSGTQIMKRGKTKIPTYSKNSPALREYKELVRKIRNEPGPSKIRSDSENSVYEDAKADHTDNEKSNKPDPTLVDILNESLSNKYKMVNLKETEMRDIEGLTPGENRELRGVLSSQKLEGRTGPNGALQLQADFLRETIRRTRKEAARSTSYEECKELKIRIEGLEEARERTLERKKDEEVADQQLEDISRLKRFSKWLGKEKVGLTGIAVSLASLITSLLVAIRGVVLTAAKATGKVAKALANIAKKGAPMLVPVLNVVALALSWGAKGIAWLASNLWVIVIAAVLLVYNYYTK